MTTKPSRGFQIAQLVGQDVAKTLSLKDHVLTCAKCGKPYNLLARVKRKTKSGTYYYLQFRHRDNRKAGRYLYHYYRLREH